MPAGAQASRIACRFVPPPEARTPSRITRPPRRWPRRRPLSMAPTVQASSPRRAQRGEGGRPRRPERRPASSPSPMLKVRYISSRGTCPSRSMRSKIGRPLPALLLEHGARAVGQDARHVAGQAAAGDVGERLDRTCSSSGEDVLGVDAASARAAARRASRPPAATRTGARAGSVSRAPCGPASSRWSGARRRRRRSPRRRARRPCRRRSAAARRTRRRSRRGRTRPCA